MTQYFARLNKEVDPFDSSKNNWTVTQVVCIGNDVPTSDGPLQDNPNHADGEAWCANWFKGGSWKQTHRNGLRKKLAIVGDSYDYAKDKYIERQPYASWSLDENDDWQAPVAYPTVVNYNSAGAVIPYSIFWSEDGQEWKALDLEAPQGMYVWNTSTLAWDKQ
jgi:hypothetical protein